MQTIALQNITYLNQTILIESNLYVEITSKHIRSFHFYQIPLYLLKSHHIISNQLTHNPPHPYHIKSCHIIPYTSYGSLSYHSKVLFTTYILYRIIVIHIANITHHIIYLSSQVTIISHIWYMHSR